MVAKSRRQRSLMTPLFSLDLIISGKNAVEQRKPNGFISKPLKMLSIAGPFVHRLLELANECLAAFVA